MGVIIQAEYKTKYPPPRTVLRILTESKTLKYKIVYIDINKIEICLFIFGRSVILHKQI